MADSVSSQQAPSKHARRVLLWLYPRLRELPPEAWDNMLGKARDTEFDVAEWVGIVGAMCLVAWFLDKPAFAIEPRLVAHIVQFSLALPLLAVVVGPLYLRRNRRGLDRELANRVSYARGEMTSLKGKES